jgi:hypothetical protein
MSPPQAIDRLYLGERDPDRAVGSGGGSAAETRRGGAAEDRVAGLGVGAGIAWDEGGGAESTCLFCSIACSAEMSRVICSYSNEEAGSASK